MRITRDTLVIAQSEPPPPPPKAAKAARREAAATAASGFPTPVPLTKVQALELLKGDLDGELFLELQTRLAKPKVVLPKKEGGCSAPETD